MFEVEFQILASPNRSVRETPPLFRQRGRHTLVLSCYRDRVRAYISDNTLFSYRRNQSFRSINIADEVVQR